MNNWCIFWIDPYRCNEFYREINISEVEAVNIIIGDFEAFIMLFGKNATDDRIWEEFNTWDTEKEIYVIKNNTLVSAFPSKKVVINEVRKYIANHS